MSAIKRETDHYKWVDQLAAKLIVQDARIALEQPSNKNNPFGFIPDDFSGLPGNNLSVEQADWVRAAETLYDRRWARGDAILDEEVARSARYWRSVNQPSPQP